MQKPQKERTVVLVKPEGVILGLIGDIISRFEKRGLKIIALKMVWPTKEHIDEHYPSHNAWFQSVGSRTREFFKNKNISAREHFGTDDDIEIGRQIKGWLADHLTSGPVVAFIIEGVHAINVVRKIVGHTYPVEALPGTIRGDFSIDTPSSANVEKRAVKNIVHASGNEAEAKHEIEHWFSPEEIHDYKRADEHVMF